MSFLLHRIEVLMRKLNYILVSWVTAIKNKKQFFGNQLLCFFLQLTLLSPALVFVLVVSSLLDVATTPFLGFAFFILGYPKPLRGWSESNPVSASKNDPRSDGHIYQASLVQLKNEI